MLETPAPNSDFYCFDNDRTEARIKPYEVCIYLYLITIFKDRQNTQNLVHSIHMQFLSLGLHMALAIGMVVYCLPVIEVPSTTFEDVAVCNTSDRVAHALHTFKPPCSLNPSRYLV
jgi:hypothetical protein